MTSFKIIRRFFLESRIRTIRCMNSNQFRKNKLDISMHLSRTTLSKFSIDKKNTY